MGGPNKLLLDLGGESLLCRAAGRAVAAGLDPLIVVLGHELDRAEREIAGMAESVRIVVNAEHALGINGSLRQGIAAVPDGASAAVVLLADMPFVTAEMIREVVSRYRGSRPESSLVVSEYGGIPAPPTLYGRSLFAEIASLEEGEGGGRLVINRHRSEALTVEWPADLLRDVDVDEDWKRIHSELKTEN